jgi:(4-(4-[2-(gamma-L-glutamylamino)ethyl]phenoxymethyl)furan-2-yl)methanamine synthase
MPGILGLDVGGANLKAATPDGRTASVPFPLWKQPEKLAAAIAELVTPFAPNALAVTMTGELCDCYRTKRVGVNAILDAIAGAGIPARIWSTAGCFLEPSDARTEFLAVAAANWHATATYAGRFAPLHDGLLLDTGSTTTDIIPLQHGLPAHRGATDTDRLKSGELVYVGARRTPLFALLPHGTCAELFATTLDVGLILGLVPEDPANRDTADGQPATVEDAFARIARVVGGDCELLSHDELVEVAIAAHRELVCRIAESIRRVTVEQGELRTIVVAGSGDFLALRALCEARPEFPAAGIVSLSEMLGAGVSSCAAAFAVAVLAEETWR